MTAAVSPDAILKQLDDLWLSLGKPGDGGQAGVLRACTMTLITVADEGGDFSALGETLAALMPEHPARSIVVRLRAAGAPGVTAKVYSQCWTPFGQRRQICCEQVEIAAAAADLEDAAALLAPLRVPDLPVVLWLRGSRIAGAAAFPKLAAVAGKVVVDSAGWPDARTPLALLAGLEERGILPGDLAWTRLTRWREVLARLFDNHEYQGRLRELARVRVAGPPSTAALYMGAWLADCLRAAGATAAVSFEGAGAGHGGIASVSLSGEAPGALNIAMEAKGEALTTRVDGISQCAMLDGGGEYALLREELGIVRRDPVFTRTLPSALRLALSSGIK